ncbi:hypothetical protein KAR91_67535 [Candidatus Pacearchaeota archaeon]|nr:hypothetical protein [Candidatus Pacearchaeota archaeon]
MIEVKNGKKMKVVGYLCIAFAAILSILMLIPAVSVDADIALPLVYFWSGTGITMLFGNAAKRIVGGTQINKQNGAGK